MKLYVIVVNEEWDIPEIHGPFSNDTLRQAAVSEIDGQEGQDYILLDMKYGIPSVGKYAKRVTRPETGPLVRAWAWSTDGVIDEVKFDASPWLASAEDDMILALAEEGWKNGSVSDEVAADMRALDPGLHKLFQYMEAAIELGNKDVAVNCQVFGVGVKGWLQRHERDDLIQAIEEDINVGNDEE